MAGRGPARSGRRNAALLEKPAPPEPVVPAAKVLYVCGARPLRFGEHVLTEGVEIPGAQEWVRVESWVSARRVRKVSQDDPHIPFAVFEEWVNTDPEEGQERLTLEEFHAQHELGLIEAELAAEGQEPETTEE